MGCILKIAILGVVIFLVWRYFSKKKESDIKEKIAFIKKDIRRRMPTGTEAQFYITDLAIDEFAKAFPAKIDSVYEYFKNGVTIKDTDIQSLIDKILR